MYYRVRKVYSSAQSVLQSAQGVPQSAESAQCMPQNVPRRSHPEDVVDEEAAEQNAPGADSIQLEKLDAVERKRQAKQIVGDPMLQATAGAI